MARPSAANARGAKKIDAAASHFSPRRFTSPWTCETMRGRTRDELPLDRHHWEHLTPCDFAHHRVHQARLAQFREVLGDGVYHRLFQSV